MSETPPSERPPSRSPSSEHSRPTDDATPGEVEALAADAQRVEIRWDDTSMRSDFANVCNAASSGEEISLFFGVNRSWQPGEQRVDVELRERIVVHPQTARRLQRVLEHVLADHEQRFGAIAPSPPSAE